MANTNPTYDHEDKLLDHEYDGIQEYDNPMPRWWVWIFWATIAFSILYFFDVGGIGIGKGRIAAYEADMAAFRAAHPQGGSTLSAAQLLALTKDPSVVALGKTTFATNCAACHGADGGGIIGPNLTDDYWLHGGTLPEIEKTVNEGVPVKGMPAWGKMLKPDQLQAVVAYVATLHGTKPAKPKEPQGTLVSGEASP
jgi:cytochrome c oxidase cbb3-type subunit III